MALIATPAAAQLSAPGRNLLADAERGRATVVGRISGVTRLDPSGYAATVRVDRVLSGAVKPGALRIGWEELAGKRMPRFTEQQRVILVVDDLPSGSLWRQRFPQGGALVVAASGDAFLANPKPRDLEPLAAYLQLPAAAKPSARATALTRIVIEANPSLAGAALARLASTPELGAGLDDVATTRLMRAAVDPQKLLSLRRDIVAFIGSARRAAAASQLQALAQPGAELEAEALSALGEIHGGLPADQVDKLLERTQPALRCVGVHFATGALAERRLPEMVQTDPAPSVRAAAATALAKTHTTWGLDAALPALADADPTVRSEAAQSLGALGDPAVPALEAVAKTQSAGARGAITALALSGPSGVAVLRRLSTEHPDPQLRAFARLALGQGPHAH